MVNSSTSTIALRWSASTSASDCRNAMKTLLSRKSESLRLRLRAGKVPQTEAVAPVVGEEDVVRILLLPQRQKVIPPRIERAEVVDPMAIARRVLRLDLPPVQAERDAAAAQQLPELRIEGGRGIGGVVD